MKPLVRSLIIYISSDMDNEVAAAAFGALGHPSRIAILRYLVECGPTGTDMTSMSKELGIAWTTLNHHLDHLKLAGLVAGEKSGRRVVHRACFDRMRAMSAFILENCCIREPERMTEDASLARACGCD